ncbi:MAG: L,D-transpeptidase [Lachnospiraceae bacterium]|nr:L,D-transpeptidase [Lachnospiraceae bacterium]
MFKRLSKLLAFFILFAGLFFAFKTDAKAAPLNMPDGTIFDPIYYADTYADLKAAFGYNEKDLWAHYVKYGRNEGRTCTGSEETVGTVKVMKDKTLFDPTFYANTYPDVVAVFGLDDNKLYAHYTRYGKKEGRMAFEGQVVNATAPPKTLTGNSAYCLKINKSACTVTVYTKDESGNYTVPYKAMVCSTGNATPLGTYTMGQHARWLLFEEGTVGQYASRITGHIWFHSVMYYRRSPDTLLWGEYNKLGTVCSHGCVRLCEEDAQWIHDNCETGTVIEIYDDPANPGPLGKPEPIKIDGNDPRCGWDPTDTDPANPWKAQ